VRIVTTNYSVSTTSYTGYAHWGELCVLDTLHQVLASPLLGPASKTASEPTAALPELARTAPHGLDRDCAEEMESVSV
jgi:hypothetical protein